MTNITKISLLVFFLFTSRILLSQITHVIEGDSGLEDVFVTKNKHPSYGHSENSNYVNANRISVKAWTHSGEKTYWRNYFYFDLSSIPQSSEVVSAVLFLYSDRTVSSSALYHGNSSLSGSNSMAMYKVASAWSPSTITWNSQPLLTTNDPINIPASTSFYEDIQVDMTSFVQDWLANPSSNYGCSMRLDNEIYYRSRNYASTEHSNASIRPKLVVTVNEDDKPLCSTSVLDSVQIESQPWFNNNAYLDQVLSDVGWFDSKCTLCRDAEDLPEPIYYLPVRANIYRPSDPSQAGSNDYTQPDIEEIVRRVNEFNEKSGTQLRYYLESSDIVFHNETKYYTGIDSEHDFNQMTRDHNRTGHFNFHFVKHSDFFNGKANRPGFLSLGRSWSGGMITYSRISNTVPRTPNNAALTVAHEFGHFFDIDHTHKAARSSKKFNGELGDCKQESVSRSKRQAGNGGFCLSTIWGANPKKCEVNGDRLCDTPADPGYKDGEMINDKDNWGASWEPDTTNLMSYAPTSLKSTYTQGQIGIMYDALNFKWDDEHTFNGNPKRFDAYEPNDFTPKHRQFPTISLNSTQHHTFHDASDSDWSVFEVRNSSSEIEIFTTDANGLPAPDTRITLFQVNSSNTVSIIESDDNDGEGDFSKIERTLAQGKYLVQVNNVSPSNTARHYVLGVYECFDTDVIEINGPSSVCSRVTFLVTNVPDNASIYWSKGSGLKYINGQGSVAYTVEQTANTSSSVSVSISTPCKSFNISKPLTVGIPIKGTFTSSDGTFPLNTVNFVSPPQIDVNLNAGAQSYDWDQVDGNTLFFWTWGGGRNARFEMNEGQSASFQIEGRKAGCSSSIRTVSFVSDGVFFSTYPNPTSEDMTIEVNGLSSSRRSSHQELKPYEVSIFDQKGSLLLSRKYRSQKEVVDVHELSPGIYIMHIQYSGQKEIREIEIK